MNIVCGKVYSKFNQQRYIKDKFCYKHYTHLNLHLQKLLGIGPLCSGHMIQLAALIGLIPSQLYVSILPKFNMKGGPITFFKHEKNWNPGKMNEEYFKELNTLQGLYTNNLTSNTFENISCIFGQS